MLMDATRAFLRFNYAVIHRKWPLKSATKTLQKMASNPATFGENILFKMAFERNAKRAFVSDKLKAREFIEQRIGDGYLPEIYAHSKNAHELNFTDLPEEFVIKVNHGSGGSIIVWNGAPTKAPLPKPNRWLGWKRYQVQPKNFDSSTAKELINYWLTLDYSYWPGKLPEWTYKDIERKCFVEELLQDEKSLLPKDFRLYTFNGVVKLIGVDTIDALGEKTVKHYMPNWEPINANLFAGRKLIPETKILLEKPKELNEMISLSHAIAKEFDWLRVDFYLAKNKIYVGELTNFPTGGQGVYRPDFIDHYLGKFF
jgi:hypothetical protein